MRRPHVYERSAPRASRGPASRPSDDTSAATLRLRRLIGAALREAEALGLAEVAATLEGAMRAMKDAGPIGAAAELAVPPERS